MATNNPFSVVRKFAKAVEADYGLPVKAFIKKDFQAYAPGSLGGVVCEGTGEGMIAMTLDSKWIQLATFHGIYFEPVNSYTIAVYAI